MLNVENMSFTYGANKTKTIDNISFSIKAEDFVLIVGKSGSGKTTLLRLLKQELRPSGLLEGIIEYKNNFMVHEIGYLFQNPDNQIVMDTVWHEIAFGLENMQMPFNQMKQRVAEIVNYFKLQDIYNKKTCELSQGQKQVVNLAAIMAMNPKIVLLDEPTSSLDFTAKEQFYQLIKSVHEDFGTTFIVVEHQYEELINICNRMILLDNGTVTIDNNPKQVLNYIIETKHELYDSLPDYFKITTTPAYTKKEIRNFINQHQFYAKSYYQGYKNDTVISIRDLNIIKQKDIIKDLSLDIYENEILCILGANGAGKSTLLKHLNNASSKKDKVKYRGNYLDKINSKEIMMVPQSVELLFTHDTVIEEVGFDKGLDLLKQFNLTAYKNYHPYDLSGGQKQLLGLIKILLQEPKVLLLDEITIGLDGCLKKQLIKILEELTKNMTIILVSHDLEFCAKVATRCGILFDGKVDVVNDTHEFFKNNSFYTTMLGKLFKQKNKDIIVLEDIDYYE